MHPSKQIGSLRDKDDVWAYALRLGYAHDIRAAVKLGFLGTGNDRRGLRVLHIKGYYADRLTANGWDRLLHDRGEKAVKIEIKAFQPVHILHSDAPLSRYLY